MKTFDWDECEKKHSKCVVDFLKEVHNQPINEEEFAARWYDLPRTGLHLAKRRSKATARYQYKSLKDKFGFFQ